MKALQDKKIDLSILVNPFLLYPVSFGSAMILYQFGWSNLYPPFSGKLLIFLLLSFILFVFLAFRNKSQYNSRPVIAPSLLLDIIFVVIILSGILNIAIMGYVPLFDRSHNYREFGAHVIDPFFNTMSIFFSVFFLQAFLGTRKRRLIIYILAIIAFQILIFRRSTIMWITVSSVFMLILHFRRIRLLHIFMFLISIPLLAFAFGLYGNYRSRLTQTYILNDLKADNSFRKTRLGGPVYISYLYASSPLANLQKNISSYNPEKNLRNFIFYNVIPESVTLRVEESMDIAPPGGALIHKDLIAGTFLYYAFSTLGWTGMIIMLIYIAVLILLSLHIAKRFRVVEMTSCSIISTAILFLVFGNFLNRIDVLIMLLLYPLVFGIVFSQIQAKQSVDAE